MVTGTRSRTAAPARHGARALILALVTSLVPVPPQVALADDPGVYAQPGDIATCPTSSTSPSWDYRAADWHANANEHCRLVEGYPNHLNRPAGNFWADQVWWDPVSRGTVGADGFPYTVPIACYAMYLHIVPKVFGSNGAVSAAPALPKIAVIGENQQRALARAREIPGAVTMPSVEGGHLSRLAANRDWIQNVMDAGYTIRNIGRDPNRVTQGIPISQFFQAELEEIVSRGYANVVPGAWPIVP